jgi:hypothetical protein
MTKLNHFPLFRQSGLSRLLSYFPTTLKCYELRYCDFNVSHQSQERNTEGVF